MLTPGPRQFTAKPVSPFADTVIGRIAKTELAAEVRADLILLTQSMRSDQDYSGYAGVLTLETNAPNYPINGLPPTLSGIGFKCALDDGDVVALEPSGLLRIVYRRSSAHNILFVTERCNSYCILCPQPPRSSDDGIFLKEAYRIVELADPATRSLCITGGEPTLLGDQLLNLISYCNQCLPHTMLNLLTNGRLLRHQQYAKRLADVGHPNLMVGIPLYSEIDWEHDYIVQVKKGFEQTVAGILNLALYHVPIELRIVIHGLNYQHIFGLAEFIYRNLPFANHVAFMALEPIGFAARNVDELWIDPSEYGAQLSAATRYLSVRGIRVSVYNHQLCVVPSEVHPYCRQSISDWKNVYLPCCEDCVSKSGCGGFFESALPRYHSARVKPFEVAMRQSI